MVKASKARLKRLKSTVDTGEIYVEQIHEEQPVDNRYMDQLGRCKVDAVR
jgi:hypothetical protein